MNARIQTLILRLEEVLKDEPWFGRSVYAILKEVNPKKVYAKQTDVTHSIIEQLYHMITWSAFTLRRINKEDVNEPELTEKLDWRIIDPEKHTWQKGLKEFKNIQKAIIESLKKKDDAFLNEIVAYRSYSFEYLIRGLIDHHIYHLGQIAFLNKMLE